MLATSGTLTEDDDEENVVFVAREEITEGESWGAIIENITSLEVTKITMPPASMSNFHSSINPCSTSHPSRFDLIEPSGPLIQTRSCFREVFDLELGFDSIEAGVWEEHGSLDVSMTIWDLSMTSLADCTAGLREPIYDRVIRSS